jgi:sulfite reductase alpha subunit-like flavoprotein
LNKGLITMPVIPARRVLNEATETNQRLGHENLGFLSESHGFMPRQQPLLNLPASYRAWDETAAQLPELFRSLTLRRTLDEMPILSAADLPEPYLLRAAAIIGIFAHAYFYVEPEPPAAIPESILRPWAEVSQRLQRPAPHLSFIDLNVYNWRLIDPQAADPMTLENMALLIPIVGNEDERRFQAAPIEMLARFTPMVGMVVRAQEAAVRDDLPALKQELIAIINALNNLTYDSFQKVNPNAHSPLYVNPVVWGKTVAPLATPYQEGGAIPGPSGTAIPSFQLLDEFFGRRSYTSSVGHETARIRPWFPPHWQRFLEAAAELSIPDFVAKSDDATLHGLFREALDAYAGGTGLLGRHRLKAYGFLDLSFKAGRSKTLGGFGGGLDDRLWDRMDGELNLARQERYTRAAAPQAYHTVYVKRIESATETANPQLPISNLQSPISKVVLDVSQTGIRYQPGDRCAILPENGDELIERTLKALRARGDEPIQLNAIWREAIAVREGYQQARVLSLRTLLRFGRIRPITRPVAKALYQVTHNPTLWRILEARAEDQWELWDLLDLLAQTGFNPKQLWKAHPGEPASIGWIVPPESFRMYSVSSVMADPTAESASEIHLTIGRLNYQTKETDVSAAARRYGTSSNFLREVKGGPLTIKLVHPPRFSLPQDVTRPVVMFAGGTGLAPFRGLLQERARQPGAGQNWLFFCTRTQEDVYYQEELAQWVAQGQLHLHIACSREDVAIYSHQSELVIEPGPRQYIGDVLRQEETARLIYQLLLSREEGGLGAYFYVCGRTGFAKSVMEAIKETLYCFAPSPNPLIPATSSEASRRAEAQRILYRLVGEDRYLQEIFTTYAGPQFEKQQLFDASEVVPHNDDEAGYWMVINGRVYNLSEFAHLHPGGLKIIGSYAGMDATNAYRMVLHDANPEVDAMLGMYEIGAVRRLDFGSAWSVVIGANGLQFITLRDIYRTWINFLYAVVEMENALANDYGIRHEPVTYDETAANTLEFPRVPAVPPSSTLSTHIPGRISQSPYKTRLLLQTHDRFSRNYLPKITGPALDQLWAIASGLQSEHQDVRWLRQQITAVQQSDAAQSAAALSWQISTQLKETDPAVLQRCIEAVANLETADRTFLRDVKATLADGLRVFERYEQETVEKGGGELVAAVRRLLEVLRNYYGQIYIYSL